MPVRGNMIWYFHGEIPVVAKQSVEKGRRGWYVPKRIRDNADALRAAFEPYRPKEPFDGCLGLNMVVWHGTPTKANWGKLKITSADFDNLAKQVSDCLQMRQVRKRTDGKRVVIAKLPGIITTDGRIAVGRVEKRWAPRDALTIMLLRLDPDSEPELPRFWKIDEKEAANE